MKKLLFSFIFTLSLTTTFSQTIVIDNQLSCDIQVRIYAGPGGAYADCGGGTGCGACCTDDFCVPAFSGPTVYNICAGANADAASFRVRHTCTSGSPCVGATTNVSPSGCLGYPLPPQTLNTSACNTQCSGASFTITWTGNTIIIQ